MKIEFKQCVYVLSKDRLYNPRDVDTVDEAVALDLIAAGYAQEAVEIVKKPSAKKAVKKVDEE